MARLGVSVAGGVLGAMVGAPELGFMLGSLLGGLLFAPTVSSPPDGPRLTDLRVTSSTYGQYIPRGWGSIRYPGNIIWSSGLKEEIIVHRQRVSKTQTVTWREYVYSSSFAIAICQGPIDDIYRIWADGKLIYDVHGHDPVAARRFELRRYLGTEEQMPDSLLEEAVGEGNCPAYRGLAYLVFEDFPLADFANRIPAITVEVGTNSGRTDHYERIPGVWEAVSPFYSLGSRTNFEHDLLAYDNRTGIAAFMSGGFGEPIESHCLLTVDVFRKQLLKVSSWAELIALAPEVEPIIYNSYQLISSVRVTADGYVMLRITEGFDLDRNDERIYQGFRLVMLDPVTHTVVSSWSPGPGLHRKDYTWGETAWNLFGYSWPGPEYLTINLATYDRVSVPESFAGNHYASGKSWFGSTQHCFGCQPLYSSDPHFFQYINNSLELDISYAQYVPYSWSPLRYEMLTLWAEQTGDPPPSKSDMAGWERRHEGVYLVEPHTVPVVPGNQRNYFGAEFWAVGATPNSATGTQLRLVRTTSEPYFEWKDIELQNYIDTTGLPAFSGVYTHACLQYIQGVNLLVVMLKFSWGSHNDSLFIVFDGYSVRSITPVAIHDFNLLQRNFDNGLVYGTSIWTVYGSIHEFNAVTGELTHWESQADAPPPQWGAIIDHDRRFALTHGDTDSKWGRLGDLFFWGKADQGHPLSLVVRDVCLGVGLRETEFDVSALSGTVRGFTIASRSTARAALEKLAQTYFFEAYESDGVLKFRHYGNAAVGVIPENDLAIVNSQTSNHLIERARPALEMPRVVSLQYMDVDLNYQYGNQQAKRIAVSKVEANETSNLELPAVLTATEARRTAERHLYVAWAQRLTYQTVLPWRYLAYDPSDVVTIQMNDGRTVTGRFVKTTLGKDLSIEAHLVSDDAAAFVETDIEGAVGDGVPQARMPTDALMLQPIILDAPLLRDQDATGFARSLHYVGAGTSRSGFTAGMVVSDGGDSGRYTVVGTLDRALTWGRVHEDISHTRPIWSTDETTTITVDLMAGSPSTLVSVTQLEMLAGANACAIGKPGRWEVLQFRTVETLGPHTYRLSGLLRGRRGTEHAMLQHKSGDWFVLLEPAALVGVQVDTTTRGDEINYRIVQTGQFIEASNGETFFNRCNDLRPYAPADIRAVRNPDGTIDVTWQRRTRLAGAWQDGTGTVPVNEEREEYELYVLLDRFEDHDEATVLSDFEYLRKVEGLTSPGWTYSVADQQDDLTDEDTRINLLIYQVSPHVGRGFPAWASIEI